MNLLEQDITFDFENELQEEAADELDQQKPALPVGEIGQQPKNFVKNYKKVGRYHALVYVIAEEKWGLKL
jgi:hypothetical protein